MSALTIDVNEPVGTQAAAVYHSGRTGRGASRVTLKCGRYNITTCGLVLAGVTAGFCLVLLLFAAILVSISSLPPTPRLGFAIGGF
jgi:hypothetical protein